MQDLHTFELSVYIKTRVCYTCTGKSKTIYVVTWVVFPLYLHVHVCFTLGKKFLNNVYKPHACRK